MVVIPLALVQTALLLWMFGALSRIISALKLRSDIPSIPAYVLVATVWPTRMPLFTYTLLHLNLFILDHRRNQVKLKLYTRFRNILTLAVLGWLHPYLFVSKQEAANNDFHVASLHAHPLANVTFPTCFS